MSPALAYCLCALCRLCGSNRLSKRPVPLDRKGAERLRLGRFNASETPKPGRRPIARDSPRMCYLDPPPFSLRRSLNVLNPPQRKSPEGGDLRGSGDTKSSAKLPRRWAVGTARHPGEPRRTGGVLKRATVADRNRAVTR